MGASTDRTKKEKSMSHSTPGDQADAARYRWLREQEPRMDGLWIAHGIVGCLSCWNGKEADVAIDTAMKATPRRSGQQFRCSICSKVFPSPEAGSAHLAKKHEGAGFLTWASPQRKK